MEGRAGGKSLIIELIILLKLLCDAGFNWGD